MFIHHLNAVTIIISVGVSKMIFALLENHHNIEDTTFHETIALIIGHGLGVIMWNGWKFFVIYYIVSLMYREISVMNTYA